MPLQPPPALVELMERLGAATFPQLLRAGSAVWRLSRDVQQFEAVWIDALVRARRLTPFQAREINAGRGEQLRIGPYLICEKLAGPPYLSSYRAVQRESKAIVRLAVYCRTDFQSVVCDHQEDPLDNIEQRSKIATGLVVDRWSLVANDQRSTTNDQRTRKDCLSISRTADPLTRQITYLSYDSGIDGERIYLAASWIEGSTVAEWLARGGRFSHELVLEIARAMVAELSALEKAGRCHGDIAPWNILLTPAGDVLFLHAGLLEILRPEEGFAFAELLPEAYDYLAPERVVAGTPPNIAGDIYACGSVWWQMLCGRPPLCGGDSLAKLRAVQTAEIPDVRRLAPETPPALAEAISACLEKQPSRRPGDLAKLAAMLGPPSKGSKAFLARSGGKRHQYSRLADREVDHKNLVRNWPVWLTAAVGCIAVMLLLLGPMFQAWKSKINAAKNTTKYSKKEAVNAAAKRQIKNLSYKVDQQVQPAAFHAPVKNRQTERPKVADYLLETKEPLSLGKLSLERGQRAIGRLGRRVTIRVPATGIMLDGEDIRLENIDFCWAATGSIENAAMILYSGSRVDFRGCRFFTSKEGYPPAAVIGWTNSQGKEPNFRLPIGRIELTNCVFDRVGDAIDCRRRGAIALDLKNCLLIESSSLFKLDHQPEQEEPISLRLTQLTMLQSGPLFHCRIFSFGTPGEISVQSESCVFAPRAGEPLLAFEGGEPPDAFLRNIRWDGSSSLVAEETSVCAWKTPATAWETLDDSNLSIAGLVRSRLEFAEKAEKSANPAGSAQLLHWQAPLPTLEPPGAKLEMLPTN